MQVTAPHDLAQGTHPGCAWRSSRAGAACACWAAAPAWTRRQPGQSRTPVKGNNQTLDQRQRAAVGSVPVTPHTLPSPQAETDQNHKTLQTQHPRPAHPLQEEVELRVGAGVARHLEQRGEDVGQQLQWEGEVQGLGAVDRVRLSGPRTDVGSSCGPSHSPAQSSR